MFRQRLSLIAISYRKSVNFNVERTNSDKAILKSPAPDIKIPDNVLLQDYLTENIFKWTGKVAVECLDTNRRYTYEELFQKSNRFAKFLQNSLKLKPNSTLAILLPNIPEYPIAVIGALLAGVIITTINPVYTTDEINKQLISSQSKALITLSGVTLPQLKIPVITIKLQNEKYSNKSINFFDIIYNASSDSEQIKLLNLTSKDVVFLPYSSGTTGGPKGVELTHFNIVSNLEQMAAKEFINFKPGEDVVMMAFLPFYHIYGLIYVLLHGFYMGSKLITFSKFSHKHFITCLRKHKPTFIPLVPPVVHLMNNSSILKPEDLSSIRMIMSGAAPLGDTDVNRFKDFTKGKVDVIQSYGMTELSPMALKQTKAINGGIKAGGAGYLVNNTEAKFVSLKTGDGVLEPMMNGEILIRGPQNSKCRQKCKKGLRSVKGLSRKVMKGYFNNEKATKETITEDGWLKTGDVGYFDKDGHIFITDRIKELIKVQGFQVAPAELETILRNHPSVEDVAVIGVQHQKLGEAPKAFVVLKKDAKNVEAEDIKNFIASKTAKFKHLVGGVSFVDSIPKNPSGKILRKELRNL